MENTGAYERFLAATEAGVNPIAPSPDVAAPTSPTRSVESRTATEESAQTGTEEEGDEEGEA